MPKNPEITTEIDVVPGVDKPDWKQLAIEIASMAAATVVAIGVTNVILKKVEEKTEA